MRWCYFSPSDRSLHVLNGDTRTTGGAEAQVAYTATAMAQLGHEVALVYGDGRGAGAPAGRGWRHLHRRGTVMAVSGEPRQIGMQEPVHPPDWKSLLVRQFVAREFQ